MTKLWFSQNGDGSYAIGTGDREIGHVPTRELAFAVSQRFNGHPALFQLARDLKVWIANVATDSQLDQPLPQLKGETGRDLYERAEEVLALLEIRP